MKYPLKEVSDLCIAAALNHGASAEMSQSLAFATMHAERSGRSALGLLHFFDHIDSLRYGRLNGSAEPEVSMISSSAFAADANNGLPHVAFDRVYEDLINAARKNGIAVFTQKNAFTCGALGYFVERLADHGLVALAGANSAAVMAAGKSGRPVYGTNPMAFAAPRGDGRPLVIDQASSQTAQVNIREAARSGEQIPIDWAVDSTGAPTSDPQAALDGSLLPFGGYKGANLALIIEVLATLSGANWSLDAAPFDEGNQNPSVGMFIIAIDPASFNPAFATLLDLQLERLHGDHQVRLPGYGRSPHVDPTIELPYEVVQRLRGLAQ